MTNTETERLVRVETKLDSVVDDVREIRDAIKDLPNQFASKYVEKFAWAVLLLFGTGLMYVIVNGLSASHAAVK